jgi:ATP-binding cassette, subfamily B, bacterial PglK
MRNLKKLLFLLTPHEIRLAGLLLLMILIMALLDVIGIASILPFMAVLTNPNLIETNYILNFMFQTFKIFGVENDQQFLFALGILVFLLLVFSLIFKALTTYAQLRFIHMREYSVSRRLVKKYLHQPYSWFLNRHSADLGKTILSEVGIIIGGYLKPFINLIAKAMVTLAIIILLVLTDPKLALIIGFSLSIIYGVFFYSIRRYISRIGKKRLTNNQLRFVSVSEAFGAVKEIKIGDLEENYVERFSIPAKIYAQTTTSSRVLSQLPHFFLEALAFGGVMLMILYLMTQKGSFNDALPIISLYIFAGYRLLPSIKEIYGSFVSLAFVGPSLDKLYEDMKNLKSLNSIQNQDTLSIDKNIVLKNVHYNYPNASRTTLKDFNLTIPAKSTIGLIGTTGSGKTTTVDIILGLLEPQKGALEIDGQIITQQNVKSWQRSIGYVPQHIYLSDDTVSANIAFGIKPEYISQEVVEKVAKIANLHEFVVDELPKQYQTTIGERGVRLSGGQRQRIGIARALYHNPKVLILDEATSALDNHTEQAVMDAVDNLSKEVTIILIAHRLNTVKRCDKIYLLEKGEIKNQGKFEELIKVDENFSLNGKN